MNIVHTPRYNEYLQLLDTIGQPYPAYFRPYLEEIFFALAEKELTGQGVAMIILYATYRVDKRGVSMMEHMQTQIRLWIKQVIIPDDAQAQEDAIAYVDFYWKALQKAREFSNAKQWQFAKELILLAFELLHPIVEERDDPTAAWLEYMACNAVTEAARWSKHREILATLRRK